MKHTKTDNEFYPIVGYKGYFISNTTTEVLCTNDSIPVVLKKYPVSKGKDNYFAVFFANKNQYIHRLMAETFISGPAKEHVNHIDGNKQNNTLPNLEWATASENTQHAVDTGLMTHGHIMKKVYQYKLNGKFLREFESDLQAEEMTKVARQNISKCTLGKRKQAGGYQWGRQQFQQIQPTNAQVLKCINITDVDTGIVQTRSKVADAADLLGCGTHTIHKRLKDTDVGFINNYRVERVLFE